MLYHIYRHKETAEVTVSTCRPLQYLPFTAWHQVVKIGEVYADDDVQAAEYWLDGRRTSWVDEGDTILAR